MTAWGIAAAFLMLSLIPCGAVCLRAEPVDRVVGLEMTSVVTSLLLMVLAELTHRVAFFDLAVALAVLSFGGGLVFARFFERWL